MRKKNIILLITLIIIVFLTLIVIAVWPSLFQEGNPIPILKGIIDLNRGNDITQVSILPTRYLTKTDEDCTALIKFMEKEGWKYEQHFFTSATFSKGDSKLYCGGRQYSSFYTIWEFRKED